VSGRRPGVLVCHEWWGNNDYSRGRAEQLAGLGYVAFALDMYGKGVTTEDAKKAGELAGALYSDPELMRRRASAGLKVLAGNARVDAHRIAAIGYCMGGSVALELARSGADLAAVVSFHGGLDTKQPAGAGTIKAKVLVCNGADDAMVPAEKQAAFQKEMKDAGVDFVFINYAGARHAFTNPHADAHKIPGIAYNEKADKRSWQHMLDLFREVFGPEPAAPAQR
jgi:dienelactone hydrolase